MRFKLSLIALLMLISNVLWAAQTPHYGFTLIPQYPDPESENYPTYMDNFMNDVDEDLWGIQQNKLTADITAPSNVTNLSINACLSENTDGGVLSCIVVQWTDSINTDIAYYEVRYKPDGLSVYSYITTTQKDVRLTGLIGYTHYCISVKAVDKQGNTSGYPTDNCTTYSGYDTTVNPPTSATATAGFKQIWIDWINPSDKDLSVIEVWRADTNDRAGASKIAEVKTDFYSDVLGNSITKYYWIRAKDLSGNVSTWGPVGATSGISATTLTISTADIGAAQITNETIANATLDLATKVQGQLPNANLAQITDAAKLADAIVTAAKIQTGAVDKSKFGANLYPIERVNTLPTLPDGTYPEGYVVYLTTDNKLYRSTETAWTTTVPTTDLTGQITTTQITDDAITSPKILAGTITASDIATGTITANEISTNAITSDKILAGAVIAGKIAANAVTATEIASDSINSAKIAAGTIAASDIGAGVITGTLIAADTIAASNIAAGAITSSEINADAVTTDKIAAGAVQAADIQAGAITSAHVSTNQIITATANIGDALITSAKIADATIATADIADAQVTGAKIANATITSAHIANATITDANIANATITSAKIASLSADKISAGTITGSTIQTAASPNPRIELSAGTKHAKWFTNATTVIASIGLYDSADYSTIYSMNPASGQLNGTYYGGYFYVPNDVYYSTGLRSGIAVGGSSVYGIGGRFYGGVGNITLPYTGHSPTGIMATSTSNPNAPENTIVSSNVGTLFYNQAGGSWKQIVYGVFGRVTSAGGVDAGVGFTVNRVSAGQYDISFNTSFATAPVVTVTTGDTNNGTGVRYSSLTTSGFHVQTMTGSNQAVNDVDFSFMAIEL